MQDRRLSLVVQGLIVIVVPGLAQGVLEEMIGVERLMCQLT